jgi:hypothetical protein
MEKYGFVYIWYDKKRKMFYIGCHWGSVDDGYICSSNRMRDAYRRRPQDFKRKILVSKIFSRENTIEEEHKWFSYIKEEELGKKYYNLRKHKWGHWSTDESSKLTVGQKISASPLRNQRISEANKGKIVSEETKQKLREANKKQFEDIEQIELRKRKTKELWADPEYRRKQIEKKKGKKDSEETKMKKSLAMIGKNKGKKFSEEQKKQISETLKKKYSSGKLVVCMNI